MSSSVVKTGNQTHDATCLASQIVLEGGLLSATTQVAVNALFITHYKNCLASALANNCGSDTFRGALRSLGAGGV
jgi:hypothetical protein